MPHDLLSATGAPTATATGTAAFESNPADRLGAVGVALQHFTDRLGAVGIALQHFTDQLRVYARLHPTDVFVATAVLTKQIEVVLSTDRPAVGLTELLADGHRIALPDGTTAAELIGPGWVDFERDLTAHVAATVAFVQAEGLAALLRLSAWYARSDAQPWWGTPAWDTGVARAASRLSSNPVLTELLLARPEIIDHLTLSRVLSFVDGERGADGHLEPAAA